MLQTRCPACANTRTRPALSKSSYQLFECADCGHLFVSPIPTQELQTLYTTAPYMEGARVGQEPSSKFRGRAAAIAELRPRGRVLDVGCAFGSFLMAAREHGLDAEGIELNPRTAKQAEARGFAVTVGTMENDTLPSCHYDAVHLGDVIEHVPEPEDLILACRRVFRPGGLLVVSTPRNDGAFARITRRLHPLVPWSHATPPHHLQQFSLGSLYALLRRCGFEPRASIGEAIPFWYELRATGLLGAAKQAVRGRRYGVGAAALVRFGVATLLYPLAALLAGIAPSRRNTSMTVFADLRTSPALATEGPPVSAHAS